MSGAPMRGARPLSPLERNLIRAGCGIAAFVVAAILLVWIVGPRVIASFVIRNAVALSDAGPVAFEVSAAGWRKLVVERVTLGADRAIQAEHIVLDFGLLGPFGGIRDAYIRGLRVQKRIGGEGADRGGGGLPLGLMPSFPLTLEDTELQFLGPSEAYSAVAKGVVAVGAEGGSGGFDIAVTPTADRPGGFAPHHGALTLAAKTVTLQLAPDGVPAPGKAHASILFRVQGAGADAAAALDVQDLALPQIGTALKTLVLRGKAQLSGRRLGLTLDDCVRLEGLAAGRIAMDSAPLCSGTTDKPVLMLALGGSADEALTLDIVLKGAQGRYLDRAGKTLLSGGVPDLKLAGQSDAGFANWKGAVKAEGGRLAAGTSLIISAVSLTGGAAAQDGRLTRLDAALSHAELSGVGGKPIIVPLTLTASSETQDHIVVLSARASGAGIADLVKADGAHDLRTGAGEVKFALAKLAFDPAGLKPETLSPALAGLVSAATGGLGADGTVGWSANGLVSQGTLTLEKLAAATSAARVQGMDGRISFSSLFPLATAAPQRLHVALLDVGLPLTDGQISLTAEPSGDIRVNSAQWNWLGGKVGLAAAVFNPFRSRQSLTFSIDGIDLAQLLTLANIKNLSGTGRLSGRIPITLEGGHQPVHDGHLAADPPGGIVVYKTGGATASRPTDPGTIFHTALDDFHYDALTVDIAGDLSGTLSLQVHLKGRNPNLYDGRRVELNLSTEGAFMEMLRKGVYGYRDAVRPR